ncbi:outer membrane beta-barrel protein [Photobacterium marinum]|uniref:outer membrane beta-barrel protein n=1 Tax=Photobacterium marinum TaxID=1056511 RepID=UPI00055F1957|nr:outer membrane beta-barrel protein [Photobacterium marinum]
MKLPLVATLLCTTLTAFVSPQVQSDNTFYFTPYVGYAFTSNITDENGNAIRIEDDPHIAFSLDTDMGAGRIGLFISHQPNEAENIQGDGSFTYFQFQSSLRFDVNPSFDSFFGASVGTTISESDWTSNDLLFSGGFFGGAEYKINSNTKLVLEARWLANLIDSNTNAICTLPTGDETCRIKIESDWISQLQTNIGITYSF